MSLVHKPQRFEFEQLYFLKLWITCFIITANVLDDEDGLFFNVNWIQLNLFIIVISTYSAIFLVLNEAK